VIEYATAEIIELGGGTAALQQKFIVTAEITKAGCEADPELSLLCGDYVPQISDEHRIAKQEWKRKASELYSVLGALPAEELANCIKHIEDNLHMLDATTTSKEVLELLAEEVIDDETDDVRRLSKTVRITKNVCVEQEIGQHAPRTKLTKFTMTSESGDKIYFDYSEQHFDIQNTDPSVNMQINGPLTGTLWGNNFGKDYFMDLRLLESLKLALGTSVSNKTLVKFLLHIAEAESKSGQVRVSNELESMEYFNVFGVPSTMRSLDFGTEEY